MEDTKHRSCILNSCCIFFSVETGAKIVGYLGVLSNSINLIIAIIMLVALAVQPPPAPPSTITTLEPSLYDDIDVDPVNLTDDIKVNPMLTDADLPVYNRVLVEIFILIVSLGINMFTLSSNVVMLMGLYKRIPSYVKFGLGVGIVTTIAGFIMTVVSVILTPSLVAFATLLYFVIPLYLLLVIRSAYYNMLEFEVIEPIYTFGQPHGKASYHDF